MLRTVDPKIASPKSDVHQPAVMLCGLARMRIPREMPTAQAHALA
jgi:hypothetical protein